MIRNEDHFFHNKEFQNSESNSHHQVHRAPVIIGKNDAVKSSILYALSFFFGKRNIVKSDLSLECSEGETPVEIDVRFCDFDSNTRGMLENKRLLSRLGELAIFKSCLVRRKMSELKLIVCDFAEEQFQNLRSKKEKELNTIGDECVLASPVRIINASAPNGTIM